jgi:glycerol-3-phosphate dehydrogenase
MAAALSADIAVVGAGIVGCAIARELARADLRVVVFEEALDVGEGSSKGNSAILHSGFDAPVGSLEAALVVEGRRLWREVARDLHVPVRETGAIMVALDEGDVHALARLREQGRANGVTDLRLLSADEARALEPQLTPRLRAGLLVPGEAITDPFGAVIALAEHAALNGVAFNLGQRVRAIQARDGLFEIDTGEYRWHARWVVNAAGVFSDDVARLVGRDDLMVEPRKGEFLIFDKPARALISRIVLPVPTRISKGILVAPTIFGNVLAGPTAVDQQDKRDTSVTAKGAAEIRCAAARLVPALAGEPVMATYAGVRAVGSTSDYLIDVEGSRRFATLSGIRSSGLTSAPAIARKVARELREAGLTAPPRAEYTHLRPRPIWVPGQPRPCFNDGLVSQEGAFGHVICLCEHVSEGEVTETLHAPIPARTLDAVKKRTWATAGRCQGYYCAAAVLQIMAREHHIPPWEITKRGSGSHLVAGPVRGAADR